MGGGDLNLKKSWHPNTMKNQEKVWKAEQARNAEEHRMKELKKEKEEERNREELKRIGQESGVLSNDKNERKLEWMYKGNSELINREEYLMGRKIDKNFENLKEEEEAQRPATDLLGAKQHVNHVEYECLPFSIRQYKSVQTNDQVDLQRKVMEDPLMLIKQKEIESRKKILENPVKLKELHRLLKNDRSLQMVPSKKSKDKGKHKKNKKVKKSKSSSKSKKKKQKGKRKRSSSATSTSNSDSDIKKKAKKKKSKSKNKNVSSTSDSDSDSDSSESESEIDRKLQEKYKRLTEQNEPSDTAVGALNLQKLFNSKYDTISRELDRVISEAQHETKSHEKARKKYSESESSSFSSCSSDDSVSSSSDSESSKSSPTRKKRHTKTFAKKDLEVHNRSYKRFSRSPDNHPRRQQVSRNSSSGHSQPSSSSISNYQNPFHQKPKTSLFPKEGELPPFRNLEREKFRSAERQSDRFSRNGLSERSSRKRDYSNHRVDRRRSRQRSSSSYKTRNRSNGRSRSPSNRRVESRKDRRIRSPSPLAKHSEHRRRSISISSSRNKSERHSQRSRKDLERKRSDSHRHGSKRQSPENHRRAQIRESQKRSISPLPTKGRDTYVSQRSRSDRRSRSRSPRRSSKNHSSKKLSEEEKAAKLREMRDNADWREVDRAKVVTKHREAYAKEEAHLNNREFDKGFINKEVRKAINNQESVGSRIRSNLNNIQRHSGAMDYNFARK